MSRTTWQVETGGERNGHRLIVEVEPEEDGERQHPRYTWDGRMDWIVRHPPQEWVLGRSDNGHSLLVQVNENPPNWR